MSIFGGYSATKIKPQLKMAVTRFTIAANKKVALSKQQTREIAKMLAEVPPKEEKARIKAEAVIRDDDTIEAYEILQLNCDLLFERINLISYSKECPHDLVECISTLIWASAVVDIPELVEIRKQFRSKYGKFFEEGAMRNAGRVVNERVASKLSVQPPSAYDVQVYLERIADEHGVNWKPRVPLKASEMYEPTKAPTGESVPVRGGSGVYNIASAPPMTPSFGGTMAPLFTAQQSECTPNPFTVYLSRPMGIVFEENDLDSSGIFVVDIHEGSPAATVGILRLGDQLLSVGDEQVSGLEESLIAIKSSVNDKVKLTFFRRPVVDRERQSEYVPVLPTPYIPTRPMVNDIQEEDIFVPGVKKNKKNKLSWS